ncbi:urease accessory protein UreD [Paenibacillus tarimensis]
MKWPMPMVSNIITTPDRMKRPTVPAVLRTSFAASGDASVVTEKYHTAPIKIAKTFQLDKQLGVIVMDVSPGMMDGDRYEMSWHAGRGSSVYLTNQSYTKVHPCSADGKATMRQRFVLEENAWVESMMEPVMLYKDAGFRNDTDVQLSEGSVWMQLEVLCPGRTLRGEKFLYRELDNRLRIHYGEELIFSQRQWIVPSGQQLFEPGAWGDRSHLGSFYCFSDAIGSHHVAAVREVLEILPERTGRPVISGVTLTRKHGLAVMAAGHTAWQLTETLRAAWDVMRRELKQLPPLQFRK